MTFGGLCTVWGMRIARGIAAAACAGLVGAGLSACGGDDESSGDGGESDTPTSVAKLSDIPDAVLVIKPDSKIAPESYRTAKITSAAASANGESVDVNFEAGPDLCSLFTGYATHETEDEVEVTVIVGEQKNCKGDSTVRTTVLNVDDEVGDRDVVVSPYSQDSIPIKKPSE